MKTTSGYPCAVPSPAWSRRPCWWRSWPCPLASPAPAQARTAIWLGTMTVGVISQAPSQDTPLLSDTWRSLVPAPLTIRPSSQRRQPLHQRNYRIKAIRRGTPTSIPFGRRGLGDVSDLVLHAGGKVFDFSDATFDSTFHRYTWTDPALGWSTGDTVFSRSSRRG